MSKRYRDLKCGHHFSMYVYKRGRRRLEKLGRLGRKRAKEFKSMWYKLSPEYFEFNRQGRRITAYINPLSDSGRYNPDPENPEKVWIKIL